MFDAKLIAAALAITIGIIWLAPLMLDQLVLFGDRQQLERAAAARTLMPAPAVVLMAGAVAIGLRGAWLHAAVAATPLVAVGLALALPDSALAIVAYAITAPAALGAVLGVTLPARGRLATPAILLVIAVAGAAVLVIGSVLAVLAALALVAWWALSRRAVGRRPLD
jgi:hypothetical protein